MGLKEVIQPYPVHKAPKERRVKKANPETLVGLKGLKERKDRKVYRDL